MGFSPENMPRNALESKDDKGTETVLVGDFKGENTLQAWLAIRYKSFEDAGLNQDPQTNDKTVREAAMSEWVYNGMASAFREWAELEENKKREVALGDQRQLDSVLKEILKIHGDDISGHIPTVH